MEREESLPEANRLSSCGWQLKWRTSILSQWRELISALPFGVRLAETLPD